MSKIIKLESNIQRRLSEKKAYDHMQNICGKLNKEVAAFTQDQLEGYLMHYFDLDSKDQAFQFFEFIKKEPGKIIENPADTYEDYILEFEDRLIKLFRIKRTTREEEGQVKVSYTFHPFTEENAEEGQL
jgi:hypothetical protein